MTGSIGQSRRGGLIAPTISYYSPFGLLSRIRKDPLQFFSDAAKLGGIVRLKAGHHVVYLVSDPDHIRHVLHSNHKNYANDPRGNLIFRPTTGEGMLSTDGEIWALQRGATQAGLNRENAPRLARIVVDETLAMLARWESSAAVKGPVSLRPEFLRLTFRIAGRAFFDADLADCADKLAAAMSDALAHFHHRLFHVLSAPDLLPTRENRRFRKASSTIREVMSSVVEAKRQVRRNQGDVLSSLLSAMERNDRPLVLSQIIDQAITVLGAATETATCVLTWIFILFSQNSAVEERVVTELSDTIRGRSPKVEDIGRLRCLSNVVLEAMRLYPPAWLISRTALNDDRIAGYYIPAKSTILISTYVIHRLERFWPNPNSFNPDRFENDDTLPARPTYAYFPFGGGPRRCVGEEFAMMELPLVVATILQRFRMRLVSGCSLKPYVSFTMRPPDGLCVNLLDPPAPVSTPAIAFVRSKVLSHSID